MTIYRKLPWQRNLRVIPASIAMKLDQLPKGASVVPVCTKRVSAQDVKAGTFQHLKMALSEDERLSFEATLLPLDDVGPYSLKNRNGWEVKRPDLPMTSKSIYLGERPIYGDWSNGSFALWQDRMVYQVDEFSPTDYSLEVDLLRTDGLTGFVFKFSLDCVLDPNDVDFNEDLLFCLNILQENVGACDIDRSDKSRDDYVATTLVDWEVFPPGSLDRFLAKAKAGIGKANSEANRVIEERVAEFRRLSPERYILGKGGFNRYVGAVLPRDVVVFENIRYGNALYVLYENWEDVSQRSRIDLLKGTSASYERIPHVDGWEERFRQAVARRPQRRKS